MIKKPKKVLNPPSKIGIIGGGQLGRMICIEAKRMGYHVIILDPTPSSSASQVADEQIVASFDDKKYIESLANICDVITYEFEHIDATILIELEAKGYKIYPSGNTLKKIQDKFIQKTMLKDASLQVADFVFINADTDFDMVVNIIGLPFMLKTCQGGYDGKGNCIIKNKNDYEYYYEILKDYRLMGERLIDFERELSIIVARDLNNNYAYYPIVENAHKHSILHFTKSPALVDAKIESKIKSMAKAIVDVLDDYGVFCVEFFLTSNGEVYINEIAPRPHNSGHYTIEACSTSQFEQLVRIITGMPLGSTKQNFPCVMANILGNGSVEKRYSIEGIDEVLSEDDLYLHLYGKGTTKDMKKMGHLSVLSNSIEVAEEKALKAIEKLIIKPM